MKVTTKLTYFLLTLFIFCLSSVFWFVMEKKSEDSESIDNIAENNQEVEERPYVEWEVLIQSEEKTGTFQTQQSVDFQLKSMGYDVEELNYNQETKRITSDDKSTEEIINDLKEKDNVKNVQPNYIYTTSGIEDEIPDYDELWWMDEINWLEWMDIFTGSKSGTWVTVGVLDTGVDYEHQDLEDNMWDWDDCVDENGYSIEDWCTHWYNFVYEDENYPYEENTDPMDIHWHWTHVAWTIAGDLGNSGQDNWIAWVNPNAEIVALKVLWNNGRWTTAGITDWISFAKENWIDVLNASLWVPLNCEYDYDSTFYNSVKEYTENWWIFVAAAWNNSADLDDDSNFIAPANYSNDFECAGEEKDWLDGVISVASIDSLLEVSWFSNYWEETVDIAAPGSSIYSSYPKKEIFDPLDNDVEEFEDLFDNDLSENWEMNHHLWIEVEMQNKWEDAVLYSKNMDIEDLEEALMQVNVSCDGNHDVYDVEAKYWTWEESWEGWKNFEFKDRNWFMWNYRIYEKLDSDFYSDDFRYKIKIDSNHDDDVFCSITIEPSFFYTPENLLKILDIWTYDQYDDANGTSMAAPHVAWAVSLFWSYSQDSEGTEILNLMKDFGRELDSLENTTRSGVVPNISETLLILDELEDQEVEIELENIIGEWEIELWWEWSSDEKLKNEGDSVSFTWYNEVIFTGVAKDNYWFSWWKKDISWDDRIEEKLVFEDIKIWAEFSKLQDVSFEVEDENGDSLDWIDINIDDDFILTTDSDWEVETELIKWEYNYSIDEIWYKSKKWTFEVTEEDNNIDIELDVLEDEYRIKLSEVEWEGGVSVINWGDLFIEGDDLSRKDRLKEEYGTYEIGEIEEMVEPHRNFEKLYEWDEVAVSSWDTVDFFPESEELFTLNEWTKDFEEKERDYIIKEISDDIDFGVSFSPKHQVEFEVEDENKDSLEGAEIYIYEEDVDFIWDSSYDDNLFLVTEENWRGVTYLPEWEYSFEVRKYWYKVSEDNFEVKGEDWIYNEVTLEEAEMNEVELVNLTWSWWVQVEWWAGNMEYSEKETIKEKYDLSEIEKDDIINTEDFNEESSKTEILDEEWDSFEVASGWTVTFLASSDLWYVLSGWTDDFEDRTWDYYPSEEISANKDIWIKFTEQYDIEFDIEDRDWEGLDNVDIDIEEENVNIIDSLEQIINLALSTSEDGKGVTYLPDGEYSFTATKDGYQDYEWNFEIEWEDKEINIELLEEGYVETHKVQLETIAWSWSVQAERDENEKSLGKKWDSFEIEDGQQLNISANEANWYTFGQWKNDISEKSEPSFDITVEEDINIWVEFAKLYDVIFEVENTEWESLSGAKIDIEEDDVEVEWGWWYLLSLDETLRTDENWLAEISLTSGEYEFEVTKEGYWKQQWKFEVEDDKNIEVELSKYTLELGVKNGKWWYISWDYTTWNNSVKEGENISLDAISEEFYDFEKWSWDTEHIEEDNADIEFEMPEEDISLTAEFERIEKEVTLEVDWDGFITWDLSEWTYEVKAWTWIDLEAVPEDLRKFDEWSWDTEHIEEDNEDIEFEMPEEDVSLTAKFDEITPEISYSRPTNIWTGSINIVFSHNINHEDVEYGDIEVLTWWEEVSFAIWDKELNNEKGKLEIKNLSDSTEYEYSIQLKHEDLDENWEVDWKFQTAEIYEEGRAEYSWAVDLSDKINSPLEIENEIKVSSEDWYWALSISGSVDYDEQEWNNVLSSPLHIEDPEQDPEISLSNDIWDNNFVWEVWATDQTSLESEDEFEIDFENEDVENGETYKLYNSVDGQDWYSIGKDCEIEGEKCSINLEELSYIVASLKKNLEITTDGEWEVIWDYSEWERKVENQEQISLEADSDSGWNFDTWNIESWNIDINKSNSEIEFEMPDEEVKLLAEFEEEQDDDDDDEGDEDWSTSTSWWWWGGASSWSAPEEEEEEQEEKDDEEDEEEEDEEEEEKTKEETTKEQKDTDKPKSINKLLEKEEVRERYEISYEINEKKVKIKIPIMEEENYQEFIIKLTEEVFEKVEKSKLPPMILENFVDNYNRYLLLYKMVKDYNTEKEVEEKLEKYNSWLKNTINNYPEITTTGVVDDREFEYAMWFMNRYDLTRYSDVSSFRPFDELTREEAAAFIWGFAEKVLERNENPWKYDCSFSDLNLADSTLTSEIYSVCRMWIMWTTIENFRPQDDITRAETFTVMVRSILNSYLEEDVNPWWRNYFETARQLEITNENNVYAQDRNILRYEAALIIYRTWVELTQKDEERISYANN